MDKLQEFKTQIAEELKKFNSRLSYEELKANILTLIKFVKEFTDKMKLEMGHLDFKYTEKVNQVISDLLTELENIKKTSSSFLDREMKKLIAEHRAKITEIDNKMANIRDGIDGKDGINGVDGKDGSPDTAKEILNKISGLLEINDIKGLEEILEELKKKKGEIRIIGNSSGGGRIVKSYDISSSLNGVLKTFSLPAFWRVISVHSSSFPNAFRETTDYTTDASAMTLTFTSEITANTTLATGQTITIIYSE